MFDRIGDLISAGQGLGLCLGLCGSLTVNHVQIKSAKDDGLSSRVLITADQRVHRINGNRERRAISVKDVDALKIEIQLERDHRGKSQNYQTIGELELRYAVDGNELKLTHQEVSIKYRGKEQILRGLNCLNAVDIRVNEGTLEIDYSSLHDFSVCAGDHYDLNLIGSREINPADNQDLSYMKARENEFSIAQDLEQGQKFTDHYLSKNNGIILNADHPTSLYIQEVMEKIAAVSDGPHFVPKVFVVNADILNAFALPGGFVYVYTGLIKRAPSEAALIGVLAHEWAHVVARHGTEGMSVAVKNQRRAQVFQTGATIVGAILGDSAGAVAGNVIGSIAAQATSMYLLGKSREAELEADFLGSQYLIKMGVNPIGLADMFEVFEAAKGNREGSLGSLEQFLSTHPSDRERISRIHGMKHYVWYQEVKRLIFDLESSLEFEQTRRAISVLGLPSHRPRME